MICDECSKKMATVHMTKIVDGQVSKVRLCEECAERIGEQALPLMDFSGLVASIPQMIASLFGAAEGHDEELDTLSEEALSCPKCSTSFSDVRESGRVGCAHCYSSFESRMEELLRRIQGSTEHRGKFPARAGRHIGEARALQSLRAELAERVRAEDFEAAAVLRDRIRAMEPPSGDAVAPAAAALDRSVEHTSELQPGIQVSQDEPDEQQLQSQEPTDV